jgi:hypothetical protein
MTRGVVVALTALTVLGATASEADGQRFRQRKAPRAHVGVSFIAAEPVGELGAFFDQGFGGQIAVGIPVDDYDDFGATTHLSDVVAAWRAAAGIRLRIVNRAKPVSIDFGVERHENGIAHFLTEGDILDHADGSISIYPNRSEADLMTFRVGVSIGIPRDRH